MSVFFASPFSALLPLFFSSFFFFLSFFPFDFFSSLHFLDRSFCLQEKGMICTTMSKWKLFLLSESISYFTKFLLTRSPHPEKGTLSSGHCPLTKGVKASFSARFMKVCRFWNIFKIAVELKSSYFGQVPSPVWLTRSRTFCLTPEGWWRIIIDNVIKSKNWGNKDEPAF